MIRQADQKVDFHGAYQKNKDYAFKENIGITGLSNKIITFTGNHRV